METLEENLKRLKKMLEEEEFEEMLEKLEHNLQDLHDSCYFINKHILKLSELKISDLEFNKETENKLKTLSKEVDNEILFDLALVDNKKILYIYFPNYICEIVVVTDNFSFASFLDKLKNECKKEIEKEIYITKIKKDNYELLLNKAIELKNFFNLIFVNNKNEFDFEVRSLFIEELKELLQEDLNVEDYRKKLK